MAKFNFKFNALKKYKENLEKIAQKELAEINLEINSIKEKIKKVNDDKIKARDLLLKKEKISGFDLNYYQDFCNFSDTTLKMLEEELKKAEKRKEQKILELQQKTKEKKIVYRIEEIHKENFEFEQNKLEQIFIDELATVRFTRETGEK
ncbi:MAG TPA: flagellar export protein FliJ [Ignavibacteriales bacterium]|nr:flagellar export protein FliJ [Ignavibacteriales bacterium]HOL80700.1 flagellar export protein FliJ [Ignavibacteriales bacterium]HOM64387.1 flagellar export protein FliJ [Ignavibacteriales bacterium]HPD67175.1 flagellar export protein FliJ [Ignavibacteriales bacterium]HPP32967.1 flagellar export protein FliJ [Ignavibacteriales bacterium]